MKRLLLVGSSLLSIASSGCAFEAAEPGPLGMTAGAIISDELHNSGTVGFLFLPPMVPRPARFGDVVPALPVRVVVDEIDGQGNPKRHIATFTPDAATPKERLRFKAQNAALGAEDDGDTDPMGYYVARWKTRDYDLSTAATYRVKVQVPDQNGWRTLGFSDVDVVQTQRQFRNVDTSEYTPLVDGDILRIKFRIDRPAVDEDGDGIFDWDEIRGDAKYSCVGDVDRLEVGVSQGATDDPTRDAALHTGPLEVVCGEVRFALDPALGNGTHVAKTQVGDRTLSLAYSVESGLSSWVGPPHIKRKWFTLEVARSERVAQGLSSCAFSGYAALSEGPGATSNGTPIDAEDEWSHIVVDRVPMTCDEVALDGPDSKIYSDYRPDLQLCTTQSDATVERHVFADLNTTLADPIVTMAKRADFGFLGQSTAGRCPDPLAPRNNVEVYSLPFTRGQTSVTLQVASFKGTPAHAAALFSNDPVTGTPIDIYGQCELVGAGGGTTLLKTILLADIKDKPLVVPVPKDVFECAAPRILLAGAYDRGSKPPKNPPPPPPPPTGPGDLLDLELDVDVK